MKFEIMGRRQAEKCIGTMPYAVISISDPGSPLPRIPKGPLLKDVLYLSFDDVIAEMPYAMTEAQAKAIVSFVKRLLNTAKLMIVHCEMGISRSAGVVASLKNVMYNDSTSTFQNPKYRPNLHVAELVAREAYKQKLHMREAPHGIR